MADTIEPPLVVAVATGGLRTGWTTGTCAAAAAKAALVGLVTGAAPAQVEVGLPGGRRVAFAVESGPPHRCIVVKDAGDDPDCTDGARMTAEVAWAETFPPDGDGPVLRAGEGIGVVTRPGLGLPVGEPSITPVPRRMIAAALAEVDAGSPALEGRSGLRPVEVTFSVPGGEAMAARTSNARLGIVGGISILGTTGVVKPFSTAAYRASVVQQIDVAAAQGADVMVLCTGTRSDAFAQQALPHLPPVCFVEVGDFTGIALRRAARNGIGRVVWVGMVGKITKLAAGVMMTHFRRSAVDTDLLASVARQTGAPATVVASATQTATARHFYESCLAAGALEPLALLCQLAAAACRSHVEDALVVEVVCVDFDGTVEVARG
ncbi:MAG TPA: cobalt-precorrin-5B (C(1))-methyltransferase [Acidimicrobiales bacterium]|nr:cobalt-precorrin-5B (C(1))-methyltransferase [Acidimicrobiales bacterium]